MSGESWKDNPDAWEHYKDVLHEGLKEVLAENLDVDITISREPYTMDGAYNIRVTISYDGEEITSMSDSLSINECRGNCNG